MKGTYRFFSLFVIVAMMFAVFGQTLAVKAQSGTPYFDIIAVRVGESVTIRAHNFPANQLFTVRMDTVGNYALNGVVVTQTNTGAGGSFQETYAIPASLSNVSQIGMRMDSQGGYYAYNWFDNRTATGSPTTVPVPVTGGSTGVSPSIRIIGVQEDRTVTILARRFPAATTFKVRVGPFYNFWKGHEVVGDIYSGNGGDFEFTLNLPGVVENVDLVSVRMDSANGFYAYNAFWNTSSWTTPGSGSGVPVTGGTVQNACSITASTPNASLSRKADFDATWTIKNTSNKNWEASSVDYKYVSGYNLDKYGERFDLSKTVKPGESIKIVVDMIAPDQTGTFSTNWALVSGSTTLCSLPLTINVR